MGIFLFVKKLFRIDQYFFGPNEESSHFCYICVIILFCICNKVAGFNHFFI